MIISLHLHKLTRKNVPFLWGSDQQKSFDKLKELFTSTPILRNPDSNKPFIVETDASNFAVGAILSKEFDGQLHPIAFISTSLTKSQLNYPFMIKNFLQLKLLWKNDVITLKVLDIHLLFILIIKTLLFLGSLSYFLNDKFVGMNFFLVSILILCIVLIKNLVNQIFCQEEVIIYLIVLAMFLVVLLIVTYVMSPWLILFWNL